MVFAKFFEEAQRKKKTGETVQEKETSKEPKRNAPPKKSRRSNKLAAKQETGPKKRRRENGPKKQPVTKEALQLSSLLQEVSRKKLLSETLKIFWDSRHNHYRDVHHACIVVDTCSRCGSPKAAQEVVDKLIRMGMEPSIQVYTALLKGYAHGGDIHSAMNVFSNLCQASQPFHLRPNVRTLNTLLRGCLWTASTKDIHGTIAGGIVTCEEAWALFIDVVGVEHLDASSYEYSATLLTQALRVDDAIDRISTFESSSQIRWKGKASIQGKTDDQSTLETLAVMYLGLARAYACLGQSSKTWLYCQRTLNCVNGSRRCLGEQKTPVEPRASTRKRHKSEGGRRAFKEQDVQRAASNSTFRDHKLNEIEIEVKEMIKNRDKIVLNTEALQGRLLYGLHYFSGGGTTHLQDEKKSKVDHHQMAENSLVPIWTSYGLSRLGDSTGEQPERIISKNRPFQGDGCLDFGRSFPAKQPIDVEIGAGFGDWISRQAVAHQDRNHVAVELRADRVHQVFTKGLLTVDGPLENLCVVGAESGFFLEKLVPSQSVSTVFCNHPEPPTQTYGGKEELEQLLKGKLAEPAHMLTSSTLLSAVRCLLPNGRLVLVTDNRRFSLLLAATLCCAMRRAPGQLRAPNTREENAMGYNQIDFMGKRDNGVPIYEGRPNASIGHATCAGDGSSYFDRLWKSGASKHSEQTTRFMLVLYKR